MAKYLKSEPEGSQKQEAKSSSMERMKRKLVDLTKAELKARIKFAKFYHALSNHWSDLRALNLDLAEVTNISAKERIQKVVSTEEKFSKRIFAKLLGVSDGTVSTYTLDNTTLALLEWAFIQSKFESSVGEVLSIGMKDESTRNRLENDLTGAPEKPGLYYNHVDLLRKAFGSVFKWKENKENFARSIWDWDNDSKTHTQTAPGIAENYVSKSSKYFHANLPQHFSSNKWFMYTNYRHGMHRMAVEIDTTKQDASKMKIYDSKDVSHGEPDNSSELADAQTKPGHTPESPAWEGEVYIGKHQQIIALLVNCGDTEMYAHLILFLNEAAKDSGERTAYFGHFTYFSVNTGVRRYVTKIVVFDKAGSNWSSSMGGLDMKDSSGCKLKNEKIILRYLLDRPKSRLSSIGKNLFSVDGLGEWLKERNKGLDLLNRYKASYEVLYVRKRLGASDTYDECQGQLTLTSNVYPEHLDAEYEHKQPELKKKDVFKGKLRLKANVLCGLLDHEDIVKSDEQQEEEDNSLTSQEVPIYLTILTSVVNTRQQSECLFGSITGRRDEQDVIVTYACVLVHSTILSLQSEDQGQKNRQIVYDYLKQEAKAGYAMVDPAQRRLKISKISELLAGN